MINFIKNIFKRKPLKIEPCAVCGCGNVRLLKIYNSSFTHISQIQCLSCLHPEYMVIANLYNEKAAIRQWNDGQKELKCKRK